MAKIKLTETSLICIDCVDVHRAAKAILKTTNMFEFKEVLFFTDKPASIQGVRTIPIHSITSLTEYSRFMIEKVVDFCTGNWMMTIQWDGFPINIDAYSSTFFNYDYIGSPWVRHIMYDIPGYPKVDATNIVGNGGFSIRSNMLMRRVQEISRESNFLDIGQAEDCYISRTIRDQLDRKFEFAPVPLALGFSFENLPYSGQFGFHGKRTMEMNGWI